MPIDNQDGLYVERTEDEILQILEDALRTEHGVDIDLTEGSVFSTLAKSQAATTHVQEQSLSDVHDSAFLESAEGKHLDLRVQEYGLKRTPAQHATGVARFKSDPANDVDYTIQTGTIVQTSGSDPIQFETTESVTLSANTKSVDANIRAVEGGTRGNVGANTIREMPSPPTGVDSVKNPNPTGDPNYTDTNGKQLVVGSEEETDEQLRERAQETVTRGGDATVDAILSSILHNDTGTLSDVKSVTLFNNRTTTDNTGTIVNGRNGLPDKSAELIVHGGATSDIVNALANTACITDQFVGGVNGTSASADYTYINDQTETWTISRPTVVDVDMTMNLIVDDTYVGDDALKDSLVEYIGGTATDGSSVTGIGAGVNVRLDKVRDLVTGDELGVLGFDDTATNELTTTPSATTVDGLTVVDIGATEVAKTDGTDASITINTTQI